MLQADQQTEQRFSVWRSLKLGSFHLGSSFSDLLTSAVWNRILISDLGIAAWPVALLSALRYFLAPLTLWAGHRSDTTPILGSRRLAYIWLGRLMMLLALPLLPLSTVAIARDTGSAVGWTVAVLSFVVYGAGTLISGAPFLALVHDGAPYGRRGQAVGIVQLMLVVSFAVHPRHLRGADARVRSPGIHAVGADRDGRRGRLLDRLRARRGAAGRRCARCGRCTR